MSEAGVGQPVCIVKVSDERASVLNHFGERGLVAGRIFGVKKVRALEGVETVEDEGGDEHSLGESLAQAIFVQAVSDPA